MLFIITSIRTVILVLSVSNRFEGFFIISKLSNVMIPKDGIADDSQQKSEILYGSF